MSDVLSSPWGPWLLLLLCGILPSEMWRVLGALLSRGMEETSPLFTWVRLVARPFSKIRAKGEAWECGLLSKSG